MRKALSLLEDRAFLVFPRAIILVMTQQLEYTFSQTTSSPFDDWFEEEREPEIESDVDDIDYDNMSGKDYE